MKARIIVCSLFVCGVAFAQQPQQQPRMGAPHFQQNRGGPMQPQHPQHPRMPPQSRPDVVHPVAAPSASVEATSDEHKKEAAEEEAPPGPFRFWDTKILNNKQPPFVALLFNFVILALIYYRFGKQPIANALKERKATIAGAIENAQMILREAKQRAKKYRNKLEKVGEDAEQNKQRLVSIGKADAETIARTAEEKAARVTRDAQFLLTQEQKQTQIDLLKDTVERATKEAEVLLRSNVSAQDQERLADEFLKKLETDYQNGLPV